MYTSSIFTLVSMFAAGTQAICSHNTHLFPRAGPAFTYTGLTGPLNWHSLNVNNTLCAKGKQQTPINLDSGITVEPGVGYVLHYPNTPFAEFENLGTTVEVLGDAINGKIKFGNKDYFLRQFHFHAPSEHRIDEEFYPVEVHFVHAAADNALAVLGFVIQIGSTNDPLLNKILPYVNQIPNKGDHIEVGPLHFGTLANTLKNHPVYRYKGSLTTPPCSEGLEWIVSKKALTLDFLTFNKLKKVVKFNSRYTQNTPGQINLLENAKNTVP